MSITKLLAHDQAVWETAREKGCPISMAREVVACYLAARARIDGAKMLPREITEAQRIAAVNTTLPGLGEPPLYEKLFRAMHDATPKDKS